MAQRTSLVYKPNNYRDLINSDLLFHCDNLECIDYLLKHGFESKIDLVYIDPPFDATSLERNPQVDIIFWIYFHSLGLACHPLRQGDDG
jgi:16S rRNA G966 N2-methylase RsmD